MDPIQSLIDRLRNPIDSLKTLQSLLAAPLAAISLLPPRFHVFNTESLPPHTLSISKHIPQIQRLLLTHIAPAWAPELIREGGGQEGLLTAYFVPDVFYNASQAAGDIARIAYGTLVSVPLSDFALKCLDRLAVEYPVDRLYWSVFGVGKMSMDKRVREVEWEDCVRDICMVPAKVANSLAERARTETPESLENGVYFGRLSERVELMIFQLAKKEERRLDALAYLLTKLVNVGLFPAHPPVARSQPAFFSSTLPIIRKRIDVSTHIPSAYSAFWPSVFLALSSSLTLQSVVASFFGALTPEVEGISSSTDRSISARSRVRGQAAVLQSVLGRINPGVDTQALWEMVMSVVLDREWSEPFARVFVAWMSGGAVGAEVDLKGSKVLEAFLDVILDMWASPEHIKHSLISRHRYTTSLFLLTVSYLPSSSPATHDLVSNPTFITGISAYISHLDPLVRRCGMLAAEVVAQRAEKKLAFGDWEGDEQGKPWCRALRTLLDDRDIDAALPVAVDEVTQGGEIQADEEIVTPSARTSLAAQKDNDIQRHTTATIIASTGYDSDDSLTGYASGESSRSASPTLAELAEIEVDPTLNVGRKKVARPVYLAQLGELLRGSTAVGTDKNGGPDDPHEADRIEMGLSVAEELIRRKIGYGTELEENAVNLTCVLLGMNDNYELEEFDAKRQGAMRALVVGAPAKVAATLIQEFFKNQYSVEQRFVALNVLALGARELASLTIPPSRVAGQRTEFPSKTLPAPLHRKYLAAAGHADTDSLPQIMDDISKLTLDKERSASTNAPEIVRERRLRLQKTRPSVTELPSSSASSLNPYTSLQPTLTRPPTRYLDVAASCFIMPLIHAFWAFLRDEQTREARTAQLPGRARYHGTGTGLILNPMVLAQLLRTVAILVHAAQLAPEWIGVIAPGALELAVTVGTRPISHDELGSDDAARNQEGHQAKEASVLTAALELALVILDGALELDGGKILGLEHTMLVLGVREWAEKVFKGLERGLRVQGGAGVHEVKLSRAAAGVLLKIDDLMGRWGRSMLDTR